MDFTVIIPSRYGSTRLPAKALADIAGQPLIAHVVARANASKARSVIVATDDERIRQALIREDCEVLMTSPNHQSGSDRLAEVVALQNLDDDTIVVNVQGDEPLIPARLINEVANCLANDPHAAVATAAQPIKTNADFNNPNIVKVVMDQHQRALYFSRAGIPFSRDDSNFNKQAWHHIGIYAYRAGFLQRFTAMPPSPMERIEGLEQLRVLESGVKIAVLEVDYDAGIGVDTPADLAQVRKIISRI